MSFSFFSKVLSNLVPYKIRLFSHSFFHSILFYCFFSSELSINIQICLLYYITKQLLTQEWLNLVLADDERKQVKIKLNIFRSYLGFIFYHDIILINIFYQMKSCIILVVYLSLYIVYLIHVHAHVRYSNDLCFQFIIKRSFFYSLFTELGNILTDYFGWFESVLILKFLFCILAFFKT